MFFCHKIVEIQPWKHRMMIDKWWWRMLQCETYKNIQWMIPYFYRRFRFISNRYIRILLLLILWLLTETKKNRFEHCHWMKKMVKKSCIQNIATSRRLKQSSIYNIIHSLMMFGSYIFFSAITTQARSDHKVIS